MSAHSSRRGFTLIELLVVISVIALLIAILLPALGSARTVSKQVICLSNLRQAGIGLANYIATYNEYVPGPNTSGYASMVSGVPGPRAIDPIQPDDWQSPILADAIGLPSNWRDRLVRLFDQDFRCPENTKFYDYIFPIGTSGFPPANEVRYNSYAAPMGLLVYWSGTEASAGGQPNGAVMPTGGGNERGHVDLRPANHRFRIYTMGPPSEKVASYDGSRYVDASGQVSFNANTAHVSWGNNFMSRSPAMNVHFAASGNPHKVIPGTLRPHQHSVQYAYRHQDESLNMLFYDGHAGNFSSPDSRKTSYFFPSGSVITLPDPNWWGERTLFAGQVLE